MERQLPLLRKAHPDVFIFLDACRADYARGIVREDDGFEITRKEAVLSHARWTTAWCKGERMRSSGCSET